MFWVSFVSNFAIFYLHSFFRLVKETYLAQHGVTASFL